MTVAGDPVVGTKRNYRKPDYCKFCRGKYMSKISTHFFAVHGQEPEVRKILNCPKGSREKKRLLTLLQNEGNHIHNIDVSTNTIHSVSFKSMAHLFYIIICDF